MWFWREEQISEFPKSFFRDIFLYLLNIFATAAPKLKQKYQKLYFNFSYCKLPELAGWFTAFNKIGNET